MLNMLLLIVFVALLYAIYLYHQRSKSLSRSVFLGLLGGVIYGLILSATKIEHGQFLPWVNLVGGGYVNLLKMIAMPLVFISILSAIAKLEKASLIGSISLWVIGTLLITTGIAALDGAIIANLFNLDAGTLVAGETEIARGQSIVERSGQVSNLTVPSLLLSFIPTNITATFAGLADTSMISAVIIASLLGIATLAVHKKEPEKEPPSFTPLTWRKAGSWHWYV